MVSAWKKTLFPSAAGAEAGVFLITLDKNSNQGASLIKGLSQGLKAAQRLVREDLKVEVNPFAAWVGRDVKSKQISTLRGKMDVKTWSGLMLLISLVAVVV